MFANVIVLFAVVAVVVLPVAIFIGFCDWAAENHRVPFFWNWYLKWNRAEGRRRVFTAKVAARR